MIVIRCVQRVNAGSRNLQYSSYLKNGRTLITPTPAEQIRIYLGYFPIHRAGMNFFNGILEVPAIIPPISNGKIG